MGDLLNIGRSGLMVSKKALQTTSHNISNSNTEGYSRQRVTQKTTTPIGSGKHVMGTGVEINEVKRVHDTLIEKKLNNSSSHHSMNQERTFQLSRLEEVFNEVNSEGLNKVLNRFFNSFRELSNQPENETVRAVVRDNAKIVVSDFKRARAAITDVKKMMDKRVEAAASDINTLSDTIASLNVEITRLENQGGETGDLRDQRDGAVSQMATYFKVQTYQDEKGQFTVNADGAGSIVTGAATIKVMVGGVTDEVLGAADDADIHLFFEGRKNYPITPNLKGGRLGALVKTRNDEVSQLHKEMDELSYGLVRSTNAIHRRGYVGREIKLDANGVSQEQKPVTGINFFKEPMDFHQAAAKIELSDEVLEDLSNITTGVTPNAPGDNRIALAISKLQHEKVLDGGSTTFEEQYLKSVGKIGLRTAKSKIDTEQSSGILAQAKTVKERLSGVSLDEETANMVRYQHAYDASARVMRVADEMFDTVLGMMR